MPYFFHINFKRGQWRDADARRYEILEEKTQELPGFGMATHKFDGVTYLRTNPLILADSEADYAATVGLARVAGAGSTSALDVTYDPTASGLAGTNVQDAIDELAGLVDPTAPMVAPAYDPAVTYGNCSIVCGADGQIYTVIPGQTPAAGAGDPSTDPANWQPLGAGGAADAVSTFDPATDYGACALVCGSDGNLYTVPPGQDPAIGVDPVGDTTGVWTQLQTAGDVTATTIQAFDATAVYNDGDMVMGPDGTIYVVPVGAGPTAPGADPAAVGMVPAVQPTDTFASYDATQTYDQCQVVCGSDGSIYTVTPGSTVAPGDDPVGSTTGDWSQVSVAGDTTATAVQTFDATTVYNDGDMVLGPDGTIYVVQPGDGPVGPGADPATIGMSPAVQPTDTVATYDATATYDQCQIVCGSDGNLYTVVAAGSTVAAGDDPVTSTTGDWSQMQVAGDTTATTIQQFDATATYADGDMVLDPATGIVYYVAAGTGPLGPGADPVTIGMAPIVTQSPSVDTAGDAPGWSTISDAQYSGDSTNLSGALTNIDEALSGIFNGTNPAVTNEVATYDNTETYGDCAIACDPVTGDIYTVIPGSGPVTGGGDPSTNPAWEPIGDVSTLVDNADGTFTHTANGVVTIFDSKNTISAVAAVGGTAAGAGFDAGALTFEAGAGVDLVSDGAGKITIAAQPVAGPFTPKGTWDAATNAPALAADGTGAVSGDIYVISVAGTTALDGPSGPGTLNSWGVGDNVFFDGSTWQQVNNQTSLSVLTDASPTAGQFSHNDGLGTVVAVDHRDTFSASAGTGTASGAAFVGKSLDLEAGDNVTLTADGLGKINIASAAPDHLIQASQTASATSGTSLAGDVAGITVLSGENRQFGTTQGLRLQFTDATNNVSYGLNPAGAADTTAAGTWGGILAAENSQNQFLNGSMTWTSAIPAFVGLKIYELGDVVYDPADNKIYRLIANDGLASAATFALDVANWEELSPAPLAPTLTYEEVGPTAGGNVLLTPNRATYLDNSDGVDYTFILPDAPADGTQVWFAFEDNSTLNNGGLVYLEPEGSGSDEINFNGDTAFSGDELLIEESWYKATYVAASTKWVVTGPSQRVFRNPDGNIEAGVMGLVPAPGTSDYNRFLNGGEDWTGLFQNWSNSPNSVSYYADDVVVDPATKLIYRCVNFHTPVDGPVGVTDAVNWEEISPSIASIMVGASTVGDTGVAGSVPKPLDDEQNKVLTGDGTWRQGLTAWQPNTDYEAGDLVIDLNANAPQILKANSAFTSGAFGAPDMTNCDWQRVTGAAGSWNGQGGASVAGDSHNTNATTVYTGVTGGGTITFNDVAGCDEYFEILDLDGTLAANAPILIASNLGKNFNGVAGPITLGSTGAAATPGTLHKFYFDNNSDEWIYVDPSTAAAAATTVTVATDGGTCDGTIAGDAVTTYVGNLNLKAGKNITLTGDDAGDAVTIESAVGDWVRWQPSTAYCAGDIVYGTLSNFGGVQYATKITADATSGTTDFVTDICTGVLTGTGGIQFFANRSKYLNAAGNSLDPKEANYVAFPDHTSHQDYISTATSGSFTITIGDELPCGAGAGFSALALAEGELTDIGGALSTAPVTLALSATAIAGGATWNDGTNTPKTLDTDFASYRLSYQVNRDFNDPGVPDAGIYTLRCATASCSAGGASTSMSLSDDGFSDSSFTGDAIVPSLAGVQNLEAGRGIILKGTAATNTVQIASSYFNRKITFTAGNWTVGAGTSTITFDVAKHQAPNPYEPFSIQVDDSTGQRVDVQTSWVVGGVGPEVTLTVPNGFEFQGSVFLILALPDVGTVTF